MGLFHGIGEEAKNLLYFHLIRLRKQPGSLCYELTPGQDEGRVTFGRWNNTDCSRPGRVGMAGAFGFRTRTGAVGMVGFNIMEG